MTKNKFKKGDKVVPLSPKKSWRSTFPDYVSSMDYYVGRVGEIIDVWPACGTTIYQVRFSPASYWQYRRTWFRPASQKDKRIDKFLRNIGK